MKRLILIMIVLGGCSSLLPLHRSKLITAFHLIEDKKYVEAKAFIEGMIEDENAAQWSRTWHARGLLYQNAYEEGVKNNQRHLTELKPNQLFVAYESYEMALSLEAGNGIRNQLAPKYVLLANTFQLMGQKNFQDGKYDEALEAFETVYKIRHSELLNLETDTNLLYNAAIAAIKGRQTGKAIQYLYRLDGYNYGTNVTHLLFQEYLQRGDTLQAQTTLERGIEKYDDTEELILMLVDLHFAQEDVEQSLGILDRKSTLYPDKYRIPYTKGLILQKTGQYSEAITAYEEALALEPEESIIFAQIAVCYYNIGIEIEEYARTLNLNSLVDIEREHSTAALELALNWLNKAMELKTIAPEALVIIQELYSLLEISDRLNGHLDNSTENQGSDTK